MSRVDSNTVESTWIGTRLLSAPDAAVASVDVQMGEIAFSSTGTAKTHPRDTPNDEIGATLALARALEGLAADLNDYAYELIEGK